MSALDELLTLTKRDDMAAEVRQLRAESAAFYAALPIQSGDRIALHGLPQPTMGSSPGWVGFREILIEGMPGEAAEVRWSDYARCVVVGFRPEIEWSVGTDSHPHRYLRDQRSTFAVRFDQVRLATDADVPPGFPGYCAQGCEPRRWIA